MKNTITSVLMEQLETYIADNEIQAVKRVYPEVNETVYELPVYSGDGGICIVIVGFKDEIVFGGVSVPMCAHCYFTVMTDDDFQLDAAYTYQIYSKEDGVFHNHINYPLNHLFAVAERFLTD